MPAIPCTALIDLVTLLHQAGDALVSASLPLKAQIELGLRCQRGAAHLRAELELVSVPVEPGRGLTAAMIAESMRAAP